MGPVLGRGGGVVPGCRGLLQRRERQFAEDAQRLQRRLRAQTIDLVRFREAFASSTRPAP